MRKQIILRFSVLLLLFSATSNFYAADPCDRACLEGTIDKVLTAMISHNPSQLMFANTVRYTENGVELRIGDGMWATLSARGKYNLYVADPESGQVGFYGTVSENGVINLIALRVKVYEALIEEIEMIVVRTMALAGYEPPITVGEKMELKQVRPQLLETVPPSKRMTREQLIEVSNSYFTGLANQTGNFTAPFCETCDRWENGNQTTNLPPNPETSSGSLDILAMGCEGQQKTGWFAFVTEIRNRRFPIVDIERGIVMSFAYFDHNAAIREYRLPDGTVFPNVLKYPLTLEVSELFQIRDGKIDQIEAVINKFVPYTMKSDVWDK